MSYSYTGTVTSLTFYQREEGNMKVVFLKPMKCTGLEKEQFFSFFSFDDFLLQGELNK